MPEISEKINIMTCSECELAIIEGRMDDPEVVQHLSACAECREFAEFQQEMLSAEAVIPGAIPEFSAIKAEADRRARAKHNVLRLIVVPFSMAAAAAVAVGGIFFQNFLPTDSKLKNNAEIVPTVQNVQEYPAVFAEDYFFDSEEFAYALEESSIMLAWDAASSSENQCRNSMRAALYGNDQWSIEVFNPYSEE